MDRPFAETRGVIAGYTRIRVKSREEAMDWNRRFRNLAGKCKIGEMAVRQLFELDDFEPGGAIERCRELDGKPGK